MSRPLAGLHDRVDQVVATRPHRLGMERPNRRPFIGNRVPEDAERRRFGERNGKLLDDQELRENSLSLIRCSNRK